MSCNTCSTRSHLLARLGMLFLLPVGTLIILLIGISPPSLSPPTISAAPLAAPELDLNGAAPGITYTATFTEDGGTVDITNAPVITATGCVTPLIASATVTLTNHPDGTDEAMAATGNSTITVSYNTGTGVLRLSGSDTITNYETALGTVTYNNISQDPDTADRIIHFVVENSCGETSAVVTSTVEVVSVNDAPTAVASVDPAVVCLGYSGTLDGNGSYDHPAENHLLTYKWTQTGAPPATIGDDAASVTTFTAPNSATVLTFTLTVTDAPGGGLTPLTGTAQVSVTVANTPIAGLLAFNSSRSILGQPTVLSATVTAGCSVEYAWDFGDDVTGTGQTTSHVYGMPGIYTAVVTATHYPLTDLLTATTRVTITYPSGGYYVPPNYSHTTRDPGLLVTAVQDGTIVDIVDDDADGDDDDTYMGIELNKGESFAVCIQDGVVNDDRTGPQITQGDYFRVMSHKPLIVSNFTRNSYWEHEFMPATNNTRGGTDFYFYVDVYGPQFDPIAYSDNTLVKLIDVTDIAHTGTGKASVVSDAAGTVVLTATLNAGEDLWEVYAQHDDLSRGHTYHLLTNKRVALQYGARLGYSTGNSGRRDGGAYVPSKSGRLTGRTFYFGIPHAHINEGTEGDISRGAKERELRIVTYDEGADVSVRGWNKDLQQWDDIHSEHLGPHGHLELIGADLLTYTWAYNRQQGHYFFEVLATADVSVFETNWFETGNYGTSDIATYVSAETGTRGRRFEAYLGPPGTEPDLEDGIGSVQLTHLYVFANEETDVIAYDSDAYGEWIELYNTTPYTVDLSDWTLTNGNGASVNLSGTIAAGDYYLLEYHEKATEEPTDFVYGDLYPYFKLGNGEDTLTLQGVLTGGVVFSDSFSYDETWDSHGIHAALARITPTNSANNSTNWADATTPHANSSSNLGDYWGTPGAANDGYSGDGSGPQQGVVINEFMSGRIWRHFTITESIPGTGGYHDIALDCDEWEAIHNGNRPNSGREDPEGPYIIVEADKYVNVMNTNWNDNWMAYATPTRYPDPSIVYLPSHYQRRPGEVVTFTADVWTEETVLYNPVTTIEIPANMDYTLGSYISPTQLLATATVTEIHNADGSWTISWDHGVEMTTTTSYQFVVAAVVPSGTLTGTWLHSVASTTGTDDPDPILGHWYTAQDVANVVVGEDEVREVDLVINEVMADPVAGGEWIELYNAGTTDIILTGKVLSATGEVSDTVTFSYTIPQLGGSNFVLGPDSYVVIHLTDGTDSQTDLYAGSGTAGALNDTEGRVSLFAEAQFDINTLIDFVQWDDDGILSHTTGDNLAATAGQWSDGDYVTSTLQGDTLGRDRYSSDTNDAADWENTGGIHSGAPTPCAVNWTHPGLNLIKIADPVVIYPGETVLYTYRLANSGEESLSNVSVVDDNCSPLTFASGDTNSNDELDKGEVWLYTCSKRLYRTTTNHATAGGDPPGAAPRVYDSASASVIATTGPVNHPPEPQDDWACTHRGVTATITIDVLDNDSDPDGDHLEVIAVGTPHTGTVTFTANDVTYTPPNDTFTGTVVFTYTVMDDSTYPPGPLTATARITVYVEKNLPPIANDDIVYVVMGKPRIIYVLNNDSDENNLLCDVANLTIIAVGQPITGSITWNDKTVTYYPPDNYTGTVPFTVTFPYTISDNALGVTGPLTDSAIITVIVVYPVGGYTEPMSVPLWPWIMLVPLVSVGVVIAVALKSHKGRERITVREFP